MDAHELLTKLTDLIIKTGSQKDHIEITLDRTDWTEGEGLISNRDLPCASNTEKKSMIKML